MTFLACQRRPWCRRYSFQNRIFNVLEGIFSLHAHIRKMQIGRTHHEILALASQSSISIPRTRPAKFRGNDVAAPGILTLLHSRSALMPWSWVFSMTIWPEYHNAARHLSVSSQSRIVRPWSCQKGYRRLKKQCCASTFRLSFKALSPSAGPSKEQFLGGGRQSRRGLVQRQMSGFQ